MCGDDVFLRSRGQFHVAYNGTFFKTSEYCFFFNNKVEDMKYWINLRVVRKLQFISCSPYIFEEFIRVINLGNMFLVIVVFK